MDIVNIQMLSFGRVIEADVCVVGSGPAGVTLVRELSGSGLRILLLESGGIDAQPSVDALSETESIGWPRSEDQSLTRPRVLGGASALWTGRCVPFDAIDYEARPWVPYSGWPLGPADLHAYHRRAAAHLGLGVGAGYEGADFWRLARRTRPTASIESDTLLPFFWQYSRDGERRLDPMHFGRTLRSSPAAGTRVLTNATVTHINVNSAANSVESVEAASPDGRRWTIKAPTIVLCAGGIENARLLLASNRQAPAGLGNGHDLVGRFLMDHPRGSAATFDIGQYSQLRRYFTLHNVKSSAGSHLFCQGLRLNPIVQREEGLLNAACWLTEIITHDDPWSALKRLMRGKGSLRRDGSAVARNLGLLATGVHRHLVQRNGLPRKVLQLKLSCIVEQRPDPQSRIMLSDRTDPLGVPTSTVDWRVNEDEQRTFRRLGELVAEAVGRQGLRPPVLEPWVADGSGFPAEFKDNAHPIGTTRMADQPSRGVVNRNGQVHGIAGLYVSGSSVFPTAGHANPTQTIVALAIRLADTIKRVAPERGREPLTVPAATLETA